MSIMPPDPDGKLDPSAPSCATLGCPEPATLVGTFYDHDSVTREVTYCTYCAGYMYQQFEITGRVTGSGR